MKAIVVLFILAHSIAAAAAERPADFAYGMTIHTDAQDALYEFQIPAAVYRAVTRGDLGDIRVFNGQGEVVPHALRPRALTVASTVPAVRLPLFPLLSESAAKLDDLNVQIEKRADGTIVSIRGPVRASAPKARLRGYLLDASAVTQAIQALRFEWPSGAEDFVGRVRVEGSDNLSVWTSLAESATVAKLTFGGHQIRQDRVELRPGRYKYLRLSWAERPNVLESLTVRAEPVANIIAARRVWHKIAGEAVPGKAGEYRYDLGGPFPFDRLRIELPQVNSLAELQILTRAKTSDDWHALAQATVYRLRDRDAEVTSPAIVLISRGERFWLLRVDQKGGGIGAGVPALQIGWVPEVLVFAARGAGPFQFVYGNSAAKAAAYAIDALIPGYKTDAEFKVKTAALGEPVTLAGTRSFGAPMDYKKWTLWGILILGVFVLAAMAYRLARQVTTPPADETDNSK